MSFWSWLKGGKVEKTDDIPFKRKGEQFRGFKITWPWPGDNNFEGEDRD